MSTITKVKQGLTNLYHPGTDTTSKELRLHEGALWVAVPNEDPEQVSVSPAEVATRVDVVSVADNTAATAALTGTTPKLICVDGSAIVYLYRSGQPLLGTVFFETTIS